MGKNQTRLGELELEVLKLIWQHQPCTVPQIADLLAQRRGQAVEEGKKSVSARK